MIKTILFCVLTLLVATFIYTLVSKLFAFVLPIALSAVFVSALLFFLKRSRNV